MNNPFDTKFILHITIPFLDLSSLGCFLNTRRATKLAAFNDIKRYFENRDQINRKKYDTFAEECKTVYAQIGHEIGHEVDYVDHRSPFKPVAPDILFSIYCTLARKMPVPLPAIPTETDLQTLAFRCIVRGNKHALLCMKQSAPVDLYKKLYYCRSSGNETLLDRAAQIPGQRAIKIISFLTRQGFESTPSITKVAIEHNNYETLKWLLSTKKCLLHPSTTHAAVKSKSLKMVIFIHSFIYELPKNDKIKPFGDWHIYHCLENGLYDILKYLLESLLVVSFVSTPPIRIQSLKDCAKKHPNGPRCLKLLTDSFRNLQEFIPSFIEDKQIAPAYSDQKDQKDKKTAKPIKLGNGKNPPRQPAALANRYSVLADDHGYFG